jgi:hypothetical protein
MGRQNKNFLMNTIFKAVTSSNQYIIYNAQANLLKGKIPKELKIR